MTAAPDARQYPIGPLPQLTERQRTQEFLHSAAARIEQAAAEWNELLVTLDRADLIRTYRPGSWNVQQLAHHTADAHLHGLIRLRHGLTEPDFQIQPFAQADWMTLPDMDLPVSVAGGLIKGATAHWSALLHNLPGERFSREIVHPAEGRQDLWQLVLKHDWHLRHHLEHARLALT